MSLTTTVLSIACHGAWPRPGGGRCGRRGLPGAIHQLPGARSLLLGGVGAVVYSLAEADRGRACRVSWHERRGIRVLVVSEIDDPQLRHRLLRCGAADCLSPPLDASRLGFLIDFLTLRTRCRVEASPGQAAAAFPNNGDSVGDFLFAAPAMQGLLGQIRPLARLDTTLLITGETGTGKSHLARVVHELSPRRHRPFAVVHCGALSSTLVRSELFGHLRGSFTGADCDRTGRFADARDGTILIDEIDCLPLDVQANLLRGGRRPRLRAGRLRPVAAAPNGWSSRATSRLKTRLQRGRFRRSLPSPQRGQPDIAPPPRSPIADSLFGGKVSGPLLPTRGSPPAPPLRAGIAGNGAPPVARQCARVEKHGRAGRGALPRSDR